MKATKQETPREPTQEVECCVCKKITTAYYGRWGNTGTCSKKCEMEQEAIMSAHFTSVETMLKVRAAKLRGDIAT